MKGTFNKRRNHSLLFLFIIKMSRKRLKIMMGALIPTAVEKICVLACMAELDVFIIWLPGSIAYKQSDSQVKIS